MCRHLFLFLLILLAASLLAGCNKDDVITAGSVGKPTIEIDNEYGVFTVKVGGELTVQPTFTNIGDAVITWFLDDVPVSEGPVFTRRFDSVGEHYLTVTARNSAGSASLDFRVDVLDHMPPVISMPVPDGGLLVLAGADCLLSPQIQNADVPGFSVRWLVNGLLCGEEPVFTFNRDLLGTYHVSVIASNDDGEDHLDFDIVVVDRLPARISFFSRTALQNPDERFTFAGRPVVLCPEVSDIPEPVFTWSVNGADSGCTSPRFSFTPDAPGRYLVTVTASPRDPDSRVQPASASVTVVCVDATESARRRPASASSDPCANRVFEFTPAPGQFVNESMSGAETSPQSAAEWALSFIRRNYVVSLGSFGGYIVVGFDHSVMAGSDHDFSIGSNAFVNNSGGSNEPGIVWVMQDINGNGLPDDEWYELRGSDHDSPSTVHDYSVTYYRPSAPGQDVAWTDNLGNSGSVAYLASHHSQPYYYPQWIEAETLTLRGTRLAPANFFDAASGQWVNPPYAWGYADNVGSDNIGNPAGGMSQLTGFSIANAVSADGTPVKLSYIDFVMVQSAVLSRSGHLGEVSTEVSSFTDLSLKK